MAETQKLEDRIFFEDRVDKKKARRLIKQGEIKAESAKVKSAFFGRYIYGDLCEESYTGLHLTVEFQDHVCASIVYTKMQDIDGIMRAVLACRPQEMNGKTLTAYRHNFNYVAGLSKRGE